MIVVTTFARVLPTHCDECGKPIYSGVKIDALQLHRRCWDAFAKRVKAAIKDGGLR